MKFEIWLSLLAELDQLSFAYLKGNVNFAIYSLKLVVEAPCCSGKTPSVLIILMVKEGTVVKWRWESSGRAQLHLEKDRLLSS